MSQGISVLGGRCPWGKCPGGGGYMSRVVMS